MARSELSSTHYTRNARTRFRPARRRECRLFHRPGLNAEFYVKAEAPNPHRPAVVIIGGVVVVQAVERHVKAGRDASAIVLSHKYSGA